jgi:TRAP-type mannitol/chloroaromatic compound transport system permease small subunit
MRKALQAIDWINEQTGSLSRWLVAALIVLVFSDTVARYVFNSPLSFGYQSSCMLGAAIYTLFYGYVRKHHSHVRVDLLYNLLSEKGRAILDIAFSAVLLFPMMVIFIRIAALLTLRSYLKNELLTESYWYPPVWPIRLVVLIGMLLLLLQCIVEFIRDIHFTVKGERL